MTILLIEDEPAFADMVKRCLPNDEILIAPTMADAKAILTGIKPHLVIVDLGLPDSKGLATLTALKGCKCRKIVITGNVSPTLPGEAARLGYNDYLSKADLDDLVTRIKFNIDKVRKPATSRFAPTVFKEIQACLARAKVDSAHPFGASVLTA